MKKGIYVVFSVLFLAVTLLLLVTVSIPWLDDPNGGLHRPGMALLVVFAHIGVPAYFLGRAITHVEPYRYRNTLKIALRDKDVEKYWRHRL